MKVYIKPLLFDGKKFATRYSLNDGSSGVADFWMDDKLIYVPDNLVDDPPIFEGPDPPIFTKPVKQEIDELKARVTLLEADVKLLKDAKPIVKP